MYIQMLYTAYICLHHFIWDMFTVNAGRYTISVAFGICNFTTFTRQHPEAIEHHYWADFMLPWALCLSPISMTLNEESHTKTHTHTLPTSLNTHGERWWTIHVWKPIVTAGQHRAGYSVAVMCSANCSSARPGHSDSWIHPLNIPKLDMLFLFFNIWLNLMFHQPEIKSFGGFPKLTIIYSEVAVRSLFLSRYIYID